MSLTGQIQAALSWDWNEEARDNNRTDFTAQLADGTGSMQAEAVWRDEDATLTSGNSTTLDLLSLTRTVLGGSLSLTLTTVRALLIVVDSDSTGSLEVGGAATNIWSGPFVDSSDKLSLSAGTPFLVCELQSGWTVDATHKNLMLAATGGDIEYSIVLIGTTS